MQMREPDEIADDGAPTGVKEGQADKPQELRDDVGAQAESAVHQAAGIEIRVVHRLRNAERQSADRTDERVHERRKVPVPAIAEQIYRQRLGSLFHNSNAQYKSEQPWYEAELTLDLRAGIEQAERRASLEDQHDYYARERSKDRDLARSGISGLPGFIAR